MIDTQDHESLRRRLRRILTAGGLLLILACAPGCGKNAPSLNDQNPAGVQGKGKLQPAPDGVPAATPTPRH